MSMFSTVIRPGHSPGLLDRIISHYLLCDWCCHCSPAAQSTSAAMPFRRDDFRYGTGAGICLHDRSGIFRGLYRRLRRFLGNPYDDPAVHWPLSDPCSIRMPKASGLGLRRLLWRIHSVPTAGYMALCGFSPVASPRKLRTALYPCDYSYLYFRSSGRKGNPCNQPNDLA